MLSLEDRMAITELIALHGHLVDDGRLDELNLVFAEDVTHDLTAFGLGIHLGDRALCQVATDVGIAKLLRRFDLNRHTAVFHHALHNIWGSGFSTARPSRSAAHSRFEYLLKDRLFGLSAFKRVVKLSVKVALRSILYVCANMTRRFNGERSWRRARTNVGDRKTGC